VFRGMSRRSPTYGARSRCAGAHFGKPRTALAHFRKHDTTPDRVTPRWPPGRTVDQIRPKSRRKEEARERRPQKLLKWSEGVIPAVGITALR
jgi:hypothetical protein